MPIYEYVCSQCKSKFQKLVSSGSSGVACPQCGSKKLERKFSTFAAHQGAAGSSACQAAGCPSAGQGGSACGGGSCPFSR